MGKPLKFSTPEELETAVNEYFIHCDTTPDKITTSKGIKEYPKHYQIVGICNYIGITTEAWGDYAARDGYSDLVKKAERRVEEYIANRGSNSVINPLFAMFLLKSKHGYQVVEETRDLTERLPTGEVEAKLKELYEKRRSQTNAAQVKLVKKEST